MTAIQHIEFLGQNAEPDFLYILAELEVPIHLQYALVQAGYKKIHQYASIEDTKPEVRAALKDVLGLDATAGATERLSMSLLIAAWDMCCMSAKKNMEIRAESRAAGTSRPVHQNDRLAMRKVLEAVHGNSPDDEYPASQYLTIKLEEVELNDPQAAPLDDMAHLDHILDHDLSIALDNNGTLRTQTRKKKVDIPQEPEHYRKRMRVESNLWLMIATKYANRPWLQGPIDKTFLNFVEYVLGKQVWDLGSDKLAPGAPKPTWALVLHYEFALRKAAFRDVRENGRTIPDALQDVMKNTELRSLYFLSPLMQPSNQRRGAGHQTGSQQDAPRTGGPAQNSKKRKGKPHVEAPAPRHQKGGGKGSNKGGAKGGAKGSGKSSKGNLNSKTPDGRDFCFNWGNGKDCDGSCGRVHACRVVGCTATHRNIDHV